MKKKPTIRDLLLKNYIREEIKQNNGFMISLREKKYSY
jgi:hypothetical protein